MSEFKEGFGAGFDRGWDEGYRRGFSAGRSFARGERRDDESGEWPPDFESLGQSIAMYLKLRTTFALDRARVAFERWKTLPKPKLPG